MLDELAFLINSIPCPELPGVFVVGNHSPSITIHSQQKRAVNLIWALSQMKILGAGSRVGVVGGGFAGVTAAAAARKLGAEVTIYEQRGSILHLQRGNNSRYLHPNIYDWPEPGSENPSTTLPCMNWTANISRWVTRDLEAEWASTMEGQPILLYQDVRKIYCHNKKPRILSASPRLESAEFDCVIVAAGFGLENRYKNTDFLSYWQDDTLHQEVREGTEQWKFLISGVGDGGLIDAQRLCIRDFDHKTFVEQLIALPGIDDVKSRILDIDKGLKHERDERVVSRQLWAEYEGLPVNHELINFFSGTRSDVKVILNGSTPTPLTLNSSRLNRFCTFMLSRYGNLEYTEGRLLKAKTLARDSVRVTIELNQSSTTRTTVNRLVVRHGAKMPLENLLPESAKRSLDDLKSHARSQVAAPMWSGDFLVDNPDEPPMVSYSREDLVSHMDEAESQVVDAGHAVSIGIGRSGDFFYFLAISARGDGVDPDARPSRVANIPVIYQEREGEVRLASASKAMPSSETGVYSGSGAQNKSLVERERGRNLYIGTIGCFAKNEDDDVFLITSSHALCGLGQGVDGDEISLENEGFYSQPRIATIHYYTKLNANTPQTSDLCLARLEPRISWHQELHPRKRSKLPSPYSLSGVAEPELGNKVYKCGRTSNLTSGVITSVGTSSMVQIGSERIKFRNVFTVENPSGLSFAFAGDSGSVIFDESKRVLGILFAFTHRVGFAFPIAQALKDQNMTLV